MYIKTLPVYSKLAENADIPPEVAAKQPARFQISEHQLATYRALTDPDGPAVIFNTAMTGDGKSLAGQLPTLLNYLDAPLLAMYPTNELIRDQEKQLAQTQPQWGAVELYPTLLDSAKLDQLLAGEEFSQRGEALLRLIQNYDVLLTNPDIFHYIMEHFYIRRGRQGDAPDKIIGPLVNKFRQFTFDEFHVFETPQVISVINAMLFIHEVAGGRPPRYLFLSATPDPQMMEFLERSGLRYIVIDPAQEGWYAHYVSQAQGSQWRSILQASDIHFSVGRVEAWIEAHLEDTLLPFFREQRPAAKGAIIVNSIAVAMRLLTRLRPVFAEYELTVAPNTGLTSQAGRAASYEADLLIGTSTVDVGVDFNINFLLFESLNAGTFLQRLGRLGRHRGYSREGQDHTFERFEAHALVPEWVLETLFVGRDGAAPLLITNSEATRLALAEAIKAAYPPPATFEQYVQDWGKFQSLRVIMNLNHPTIKTQYSQTRDRLGRRYEQTFGIKIGGAFAHHRELNESGSQLLTQEAMAFRGGSYFDCAILDETEGGPAIPKLYDLFGLVANGLLGQLEEDEYYRVVQQAGLSKRPFERANNNNGPLAYFRLRGWPDERRDYQLHLRHDISHWDSTRFGQAIVLKGFELDAGVPDLTSLNSRLKRRHMPVTLCLAYPHPLELKRRLYLPLLFPVYQFTSRDRITGCIAFGREALLLHTRLINRRIDCGGGAMVY